MAFALPALAEDGERHSASWPFQTIVSAEVAGEDTLSDLEFAEEMASRFPDSGSMRARLLRVQLDEGQSEAALESLQWFQARNVVFDTRAQEIILELISEEHAAAARDLLIVEAIIVRNSEPFATLPSEAGLVEGLFASDPYGTLVATSVTGKSIHLRLVDNDEKWTSVQVPGANDLSGIVGEPDDSMGWVASSNLDESEDAEPGFIGLMGLRTDFQNPVLVPAPPSAKALADLVIGPDATVYASDPLGGGIYFKPMGATQVEELIAPGRFRSPQGLALSDDGETLYVSDYRYGLAMIDLETKALSRLQTDLPITLDGIDGLWRFENKLIAIQNGSSPMRIIALQLSEDGHRITDHLILEQAHPEWTEPLGGSIAGDYLYYIATGQWDRYDRGENVPDKPPIPTEIRRLDLALLLSAMAD